MHGLEVVHLPPSSLEDLPAGFAVQEIMCGYYRSCELPSRETFSRIESKDAWVRFPHSACRAKT